HLLGPRVPAALAAAPAATAAIARAAFAGVLIRRFFVRRLLFSFVIPVIIVIVFELAVLDRRDIVFLVSVDFLDAGKIGLVGIGFLVIAEFVLGGAERGFFFRMGALFREQGFAVGLRNLVI